MGRKRSREASAEPEPQRPPVFRPAAEVALGALLRWRYRGDGFATDAFLAQFERVVEDAFNACGQGGMHLMDVLLHLAVRALPPAMRDVVRLDRATSGPHRTVDSLRETLEAHEGALRDLYACRRKRGRRGGRKHKRRAGKE